MQPDNFLENRLKLFIKKDKRWAHLALELMRVGGNHTRIAPVEEPELGFLLRNGHEILASKVVKKPGEPNGCHVNASRLYVGGKADGIGTGWALSDDGIWRQHSWGMRKKTILETTTSREKYWGVILEGKYAAMFALIQLPSEEQWAAGDLFIKETAPRQKRAS